MRRVGQRLGMNQHGCSFSHHGHRDGFWLRPELLGMTCWWSTLRTLWIPMSLIIWASGLRWRACDGLSVISILLATFPCIFVQVISSSEEQMMARPEALSRVRRSQRQDYCCVAGEKRVMCKSSPSSLSKMFGYIGSATRKQAHCGPLFSPDIWLQRHRDVTQRFTSHSVVQLVQYRRRWLSMLWSMGWMPVLYEFENGVQAVSAAYPKVQTSQS